MNTSVRSFETRQVLSRCIAFLVDSSSNWASGWGSRMSTSINNPTQPSRQCSVNLYRKINQHYWRLSSLQDHPADIVGPGWILFVVEEFRVLPCVLRVRGSYQNLDLTVTVSMSHCRWHACAETWMDVEYDQTNLNAGVFGRVIWSSWHTDVSGRQISYSAVLHLAGNLALVLTLQPCVLRRARYQHDPAPLSSHPQDEPWRPLPTATGGWRGN